MSKYVCFPQVSAYLNKLLHAEVPHIAICTLCFILLGLIQKSKKMVELYWYGRLVKSRQKHYTQRNDKQ